MKEIKRPGFDCSKEETSVSLPISCVLPYSIVVSTPILYPIISLMPSCIKHICDGREHPFLTLHALDMSSIYGEDVFLTFNL